MARAAAGALRTLAFKNEENKNQIVECGALPTLIQMLRSDDVGLHYEAVGVIGNLVSPLCLRIVFMLSRCSMGSVGARRHPVYLPGFLAHECENQVLPLTTQCSSLDEHGHGAGVALTQTATATFLQAGAGKVSMAQHILYVLASSCGHWGWCV